MPDPAVLGFFLVAVLLLNLTPGPDMLFCFASGFSRGAAAGLAAAAGVSLGVLVHALAAALGVAALVQASPLAFDALRILGAVYLLWLAWQSWRSGETPPAQTREAMAPPRRRELMVYLRRGTITNVLNPKVALFFLAFLPQFATPGNSGLALAGEMMLLGSVIAVTSMAINGMVGASAGAVGGRLLRPGVFKWQRRVAGLIFAALALRLLAMEAG